MEIGRVVFIINRSIIRSQTDGVQPPQSEVKCEFHGMEKSNTMEALMVARTMAQKAASIIEALMKMRGVELKENK